MNRSHYNTQPSLQPDLTLLNRLYLAQAACLVFAGLIAGGVLLGWLLPALGEMYPDGWALMKANTALGILLSTAGLVLARQARGRVWRGLRQGLALITVTLAVSALLGHLLGRALWIDTLLAADSTADMPGRMSIQTGSFLLLMGLALMIESKEHRPWVHIRDGLGIALMVMVLVIIAGYLFDAAGLFGQSPSTLTSPQTLACMSLLVFAVIVRRMRSGYFSLIAGQGIGSRLSRTALPYVLLLPFFITSLGALLAEQGLLSTHYATALTAAVSSLLLLVLVMVMVRRINEATDRLADAEQQNRLLLDSAGEGIYGVDLHGRSNFVNPAACRMLGYEATEMLGRDVHSLVHHHHADDSPYPVEDCPIYAALTDGQVHRVEDEVFWRKDGSHFPVEYTSTPLRHAGELAGAVVIFNDVTERKKVERMKDEFISTVSHELRTPLTSIKGSLGLLASGKMGALTEQGVKLLDIARENGDRLGSLVDDLLDINKIKLASTELQMQPMLLGELVSNALAANQGYADKYGVVLGWQSDPDDEIPIQGDASRLMQVMANLLSNAIKYSPSGAKVAVATSRQDGFARVDVTDQGTGIPEGFRDRVFDRFAQADSSDTREKGGTGLGLAISKEIIERHGGRIGFDCPAGQGTTFYFLLPLSPSA